MQNLILFFEISDVVSIFSSVSQSLHTGGPIHTVLPETLLDRLLLHHQLLSEIDGPSGIGPDEMQSLEHMHYASAVIAVYQLILVRIRGHRSRCQCLNTNASLCSAWMNFIISPADFAVECLSGVSINGSSSTSRARELRRPPSHEPLPLNESHSSPVKKAKK